MNKIAFCSIPMILNLGVFAQNTFEIPSDQVTVNGQSMGIEPGDTVFLQGGVRGQLKFEYLTGTMEEPVIIINKSGKVIVETQAHTGIDFNECAFFRLTGTGSDVEYGIEIGAAGTMGVVVSQFSTNSEIDHLEIYNVGFAGIMAKTDPNCSRKDLRSFIMKNLSLHNNYIHDTGGEGIYVGYSWYPSREVDCNGSTVSLYPHPIYGVKIFDNIIRDTQWDGLQVGSSPINVRIYRNRIENYGLADQLWQNHAVQIGAGTTGDFNNNYINGGTGGGISFFGIGDNRLFNNVIVNTGGESAIYHNDKGARQNSTYQIYNNTIINPVGAGIKLNASTTKDNLIANNLVVLGDALYDITGINARWNSAGNQFYPDIEDVRFENPEENIYQLTAGSEAIDKGLQIPSLQFDFDYLERPAINGYDVGAYEYGSVPYVPSPLGLIENDKDKIFNAYPNPTKDQLSISLSESTSKLSDIRLNIFDQTGKAILEKTIDPRLTKLVIDLPEKKGMYILVMSSENKVIDYIKVLKE